MGISVAGSNSDAQVQKVAKQYAVETVLQVAALASLFGILFCWLAGDWGILLKEMAAGAIGGGVVGFIVVKINLKRF
ncbi:MAG: hypothetical protein ACM3PP_12960, partial [Candidatus Saccharibacteria bacterium]